MRASYSYVWGTVERRPWHPNSPLLWICSCVWRRRAFGSVFPDIGHLRSTAIVPPVEAAELVPCNTVTPILEQSFATHTHTKVVRKRWCGQHPKRAKCFAPLARRNRYSRRRQAKPESQSPGNHIQDRWRISQVRSTVSAVGDGGMCLIWT